MGIRREIDNFALKENRDRRPEGPFRLTARGCPAFI